MEKNNDASDKLELEGLRIYERAHLSIEQLEMNRRLRASEYAERIKRLRKIVQTISQKNQMGILPLEGMAHISLSEDDLALVYDPLRAM
jgi:hypothetical protein